MESDKTKKSEENINDLPSQNLNPEVTPLATDNTYISPTPGEFPLICMGGFNYEIENNYAESSNILPLRTFQSKEISNISECGFNATVRMFNNNRSFEKALEISNLLTENLPQNLKIIGRFPFIEFNKFQIPNCNSSTSQDCNDYEACREYYISYMNSLVKGITSFDSIKTWFLVDEPTADRINKFWKPFYDQLKSSTQFQNRMLIINLSANTHSVNTGSYGSDYFEYLQNFIQKKINPAVWCYDLYPVRVYKGVITIASDFYTRLEDFSKMAKQTNRPFWAFVCCIGFKNNVIEYASPNVPRMRFEAFSALAFGAQGLFFWSFSPDAATDGVTFDAPLDSNWNRMPTWYHVQTVISEIKKYSYIFLGATLLDYKYFIYGPSSINFGPLTNVVTHGNIVITLLQNNNLKYLIVVNGYTENIVEVSLTFANSYKFTEITPVNTFSSSLNQMKDLSQENSTNTNETDLTLTRTIEKGGYLIFRWWN